MELNSEYGILIEKSGDKKFVKNFKEVFGRSLSKSTSKSMLEARLPFEMKYFYFDFDKTKGLSIEIEPNQDENGKSQVPERPDFGWVLRTRVRNDFDHIDKEEILKDLMSKLESLNATTEFIRHQQ